MTDESRHDIPEGFVVIDLTAVAQAIAERQQREHELRSQFATQANALLHPEQRRLTWGDYWVSFAAYLPDAETEDPFPIFGQVVDLDWYREHETETHRLKVEQRIEVMQKRLDIHMLTSFTHSVLQPDGVAHDPHALMVWPIAKSVFDSAKAVGFKQEDFDEGTRHYLNITLTVFKSHWQSVSAKANGLLDGLTGR
jgi:hypothetical protein